MISHHGFAFLLLGVLFLAYESNAQRIKESFGASFSPSLHRVLHSEYNISDVKKFEAPYFARGQRSKPAIRPTHRPGYYLKCVLGGAISCGLTHLAVTALDVAKCNMQVNPTKYRGLISGLRLIMKEEGPMAIFKGWAPTLIGYSLQGMFKFGLYEYFKDLSAQLVGPEAAKKHKSLIWLGGSAAAEFFADIALCPMEMVKVKIVQLFYTRVLTAPRDTYSKPTQLGVTFASGYAAGILCAIASQPADTLLSLMGRPANRCKGLAQIAQEVGVRNLCTKGIGVRVLMIGTLTGLQWWIYDAFKAAMGMGTSGGK